MRKTVSAAMALLLVLQVNGKAPVKTVSIPASDQRITYIGRTAVNGDKVSFDWTGTYLRLRFKGNSLSVKASDSQKNYYNVWVDSDMASAPTSVIAIAGKDTTISLAAINAKGKAVAHDVIMQKRTEGEQGTTTLSSFSTDGEFLQAEGPKERIIEYVGDSYTCGYGTEASNTERFKPETENQNLTYACAVARYFGADQIVIAHSGMGISRNYNGKFAGYTMPERYLQTFDMERKADWNAAESALKPDLTVIYLGTNDFSTSHQPNEWLFRGDYVKLLNEIKANYGEDYPILCVAPKSQENIAQYVRGAVNTCGLKNVSLVTLTPTLYNDGSAEDMGADGHPNYNGHMKLAYSLIPYVATVTGWELRPDIIR